MISRRSGEALPATEINVRLGAHNGLKSDIRCLTTGRTWHLLVLQIEWIISHHNSRCPMCRELKCAWPGLHRQAFSIIARVPKDAKRPHRDLIGPATRRGGNGPRWVNRVGLTMSMSLPLFPPDSGGKADVAGLRISAKSEMTRWAKR
jgi:hypothetical protein